jgi:hypothetical protein
LEVEYLRDTFNVKKKQLSEGSKSLNQSHIHNDSIRSHYADENQPLDPSDSQENILEIRYHIDNTKNSLKVSEV